MDEKDLQAEGPGTKPKVGDGQARRPSLKPDDLEHIRRWSNEPVNLTKVSKADLSAALEYLPAEEHPKADERIRDALGLYLTNEVYDHEPRPAILTRYFGTIEAQSRELANLLLCRDDLEPDYWEMSGAVPYTVYSRLWVRGEPNLPLGELERLLGGLARLCAAANDVAEMNEAKKTPGRPAGRQADLLERLRPLWEVATHRADFVVACLAAIGESQDKEPIRKAIERSGRNSPE